MYVSFSLPVRFFGWMRLPAMYFFLCGHCFSFIQSGISERSSRVRTWVRSVLAIIQFKIFVPPTIRSFLRMPIFLSRDHEFKTARRGIMPFRRDLDSCLVPAFMSKTALLFAGQGAQVVGMGKDFAAAFPSARSWFDRANAALECDLAAICFNGPDAELTRTENAQPGIFLVSWVAFQLLQERVPSLKFEATSGLSLGEFTALAAAGVMSFEDGL